jgi:Tfp pilus assembly protein PilF
MDVNKSEFAKNFFQRAYKLHIEGKIHEAIDYYKMSIEFCPTAEAHTCLGWAYSLQGKFDEAIDECYCAIELDEDYGNPYNDIGNYFVSMGRNDEAMEWFERAIAAPKYKLRYLPYYNLGKIYEKKGEWIKALKCFKESIKLNASYEPAQKAVVAIASLLN